MVFRKRRFNRKRVVRKARAPMRRKRVFRKRLPLVTNVLQNQSRVFKVRYVATSLLSGVSGGVGGFQYRANSIYDPYYQTGGGQPFMHDQLMAMYQKYMVLGSKITLTHHGSASSGSPFFAGVYLDSTPTYETDSNTIIGKGKGHWKIVGGGDEKQTTTTASYGAKKFWQVAQLKDKWDSLGAVFGYDPASVAYFNTWVQSVDKSSTSTDWFSVQIDYIVLCTGLNASTGPS